MTDPNPAKLLIELGELGRVIGLLYQKVEATDKTIATDARLVQEKLDTWIQTNRSIISSNQELLKLIVLNSQELQRSTASYEKGASLWTSFQQQLTLFEQRMTDSNNASAVPVAPVSPEMSELLTQLNQSCQALNLRLDLLGQSRTTPESADRSLNASAPSPNQTVASLLWKRVSLPSVAGTGLGMVLGGLTLFGIHIGIQSFQPEYRVEMPRPLTVEEAALLNWAQSPEGQQARELMRWNSGLLDDHSCEQDVKRLGVTLELQGKPASSGFCTLWIVPPKDRKFESG